MSDGLDPAALEQAIRAELPSDWQTPVPPRAGPHEEIWAYELDAELVHLATERALKKLGRSRGEAGMRASD